MIVILVIIISLSLPRVVYSIYIYIKAIRYIAHPVYGRYTNQEGASPITQVKTQYKFLEDDWRRRCGQEIWLERDNVFPTKHWVLYELKKKLQETILNPMRLSAALLNLVGSIEHDSVIII